MILRQYRLHNQGSQEVPRATRPALRAASALQRPQAPQGWNLTQECMGNGDIQVSLPRRLILGGLPLSTQILDVWSNAQAASGAQAAPVVQGLQCPSMVSSLITKALKESLIAAVASSKDMEGVDFNGAVQKLLQREIKYALPPQAGAQPQQADSLLTDGPQEGKIYDLVSYISWKVIAARVKDPGEQAELCRKFAASYLNCLLPGALGSLLIEGGSNAQPSEAQVFGAISKLLSTLQDNGYLCRYQIIWDEQPGTWPQDWMEQTQTVEGRPPSATSSAPPGLCFQIKLYLPADLEGSIALRSEEEAFWPSTVSTMISLLLEAHGYQQATVDTYFYQDRWKGPKSLAEQILLKLGDPLEQVGIDFYPTTLVMDWQLTMD